MIVEPDFLLHWKTQMLIQELSDKAAPLCVIALWAHCQQRRTATFTNLAPNALKAICRYEGEASKLRSALERCGFLDVNGEVTVVHGWADANAKLVANWMNGDKGGRPPQSKPPPDKPNGNPTVTQTGIGVTHGEPIEKSREDGEDKKPAGGEPSAPAAAKPPRVPSGPHQQFIADWVEYYKKRNSADYPCTGRDAKAAAQLRAYFKSWEEAKRFITSVHARVGEGYPFANAETLYDLANNLSKLQAALAQGGRAAPRQEPSLPASRPLNG